MKTQFTKAFTQQEPLPQAAIDRVTAIMQSGRIHRYNIVAGEEADTTALEREYAAYQGTKYCLAVTSGGQAMQIALRAAGMKPGDKVLANAYTLAPVPGAIHGAGGVPVLVDINENWHTNMEDLEAKAASSGAKLFLMSHMRGHIADMDRAVDICARHGITMIEDCAHTMGARWNGTRSGNFGAIGCFSTQTYKHMNSGEGGFLTTNDPLIAASAIIQSGSYMLYAAHGAAPDEGAFAQVKLKNPNCSARMDNVRAAMLRAQLPLLERNVTRWNERYQALEKGLRNIKGIRIVERAQHEHYVGSSFQFQAIGLGREKTPILIDNCAKRGVDIKWFGADSPKAFTSRYDSWEYLSDIPQLDGALKTLSTTCDLRVPLTFSVEDCSQIASIIAEEAIELQN